MGRNKLHLTTREIGRMTLRLWSKLYKYYKDDFDTELMLKLTGTTYKKLSAKIKAKKENAEWF